MAKNVCFVFDIPVLKFGFEVDYAMFCVKISKFPPTHYLKVFFYYLQVVK